MKKFLIFLVLFISIFAIVSCNPEAAKKSVDNEVKEFKSNFEINNEVTYKNYNNGNKYFDHFIKNSGSNSTDNSYDDYSPAKGKGDGTLDVVFIAYVDDNNDGAKDNGDHWGLEIPFYNYEVPEGKRKIFISSESGSFLNITLPSTAEEVVINCGTIMHMNIPASVKSLTINARLEDVTMDNGNFKVDGEFIGFTESSISGTAMMYQTSTKGIYSADGKTLVKALSPSSFDTYFKVEKEGINTYEDLINLKKEEGNILEFPEKDFFDKPTYIGKFEINDSVETISDGAFAFVRIKSITIPETIESVGSFAFFKCQCLDSVNIEKGDIRFGTNVFQNCDELEEIPEEYVNSLKGVLEFEFAGCEKVNSIYLPEGVTTIGPGTFCDFGGEEINVGIPKSVEMLLGWFDYSDPLKEKKEKINIDYYGTSNEWDNVANNSILPPWNDSTYSNSYSVYLYDKGTNTRGEKIDLF